MVKKPIVAGNWKMHKETLEGVNFVENVQSKSSKIDNVTVIFCPPFTALFQIKVQSPFFKSAQNCHWEEKGAFTGEISTSMIKSSGAEYVISGHSERREFFGDTDEIINKKNIAILKENLKPIFCVGETYEQRESGKTKEILNYQISEGLKDIDTLDEIIIAYEPVWAIGTGMTATIEQIEEAHSYIKNVVKGIFNSIDDIQILYGGSVNSNNAKELINVPGVDGFLIGGASLDVETFASIIKIVETNQEKNNNG